MITMDRQVSFKEWIVRYIGMREPELAPYYAPGKVVSDLYQVHVPLGGRVLRIPMNTAVVLSLGNGELIHLGADNQFLDLPSGYYSFKCVNLLIQQIHQLEAKDRTQDGLEASLKLDLYFKVVDALKAVEMPDLNLRVALAAREAAMDLIRSVKHDTLIQVHNSNINTYSSEEIAGYLMNALCRHAIAQTVEVVEIFIVDRSGDKQRVAILQRSYHETLEIEQAGQMSLRRSNLEKTQLDIRDGLIEKQADVKTKEAIAAQRTIEEQEKARLIRADITQKEENILLEVTQQKAMLEMEIEKLRMAHERDMKELELSKMAIIEIAKAISQSQNGTVGRAPDPAVTQALAQALNTISRPVLEERALPQSGNGRLTQDLRLAKTIDSDKTPGAFSPMKEKQPGKGD